MNKVSVIMPVYNAELYVCEAIASVQAQTYSNWELIVIDDGSQDNSADLIKSIASLDNRIFYFYQDNGKQGKARNLGLQAAKGEYVAFLDADDVWMPNKLEQQLWDLKYQGVDLIFGHAYFLDGTNKTINRTGRGKGKYQGNDAVALLLYHEAFVMSTVLVNREIIYAVGCFETDPAIQYCEDWHLWLNLALSGYSFYTNGDPVSYYRLHSASAAKVEQQGKVKFFLALHNLCQRYPQHMELAKAARKRGQNLVIHQDTIGSSLVNTILKMFYPESRSGGQRALLRVAFTINTSFFRKLFLHFNRN
jgi:teichuronic acid biosynthesis glycosyltransferase TuaG